MPDTGTVEVFIAGCPLCDDVVGRVRQLACDSCDVHVVSLQEEASARRAEAVGVSSVPAVAVDGTLAACCQDRGVNEDVLRAAKSRCRPLPCSFALPLHPIVSCVISTVY